MPTLIGSIIGRIATLLGFDGTDFRPVKIDTAGELQVDVGSSALPTGAATLAEQQTQTTALQLIDDLRNALGSVNTDDLQVDVKTSGLPAGAATSGNQTTMITALQLIDDLRNALQSVAADRVLVRGSDQLVSVLGVLRSRTTGAVSGANGYLASAAPAAGTRWHVTRISARDNTSAVTVIEYSVYSGGVYVALHQDRTGYAAAALSSLACDFWLEAGVPLRIIFTGALVDDQCEVIVWGHTQTVES